jgi:hypothetical protein
MTGLSYCHDAFVCYATAGDGHAAGGGGQK